MLSANRQKRELLPRLPWEVPVPAAAVRKPSFGRAVPGKGRGTKAVSTLTLLGGDWQGLTCQIHADAAPCSAEDEVSENVKMLPEANNGVLLKTKLQASPQTQRTHPFSLTILAWAYAIELVGQLIERDEVKIGVQTLVNWNPANCYRAVAQFDRTEMVLKSFVPIQKPTTGF